MAEQTSNTRAGTNIQSKEAKHRSIIQEVETWQKT